MSMNFARESEPFEDLVATIKFVIRGAVNKADAEFILGKAISNFNDSDKRHNVSIVGFRIGDEE